MNKLRVIDLLNKIAKGEEVPKEIKYNACLFAFERQSQDYYCEEYGNLFEYLINEHRTGEFLNDEVEIIEEEPRDIEVCGSLFTRSEYNRLAGIKEDKKIEKIKILNCDNYVKKENYETILTMQEITLDIQTLRHKLDEIIDYLGEKEC